MKKLIFLYSILAAFTGKAQLKTFSEQEFLAVLFKYHPVAKQANLKVKIAEAGVTANRGQFDPVLSSVISRKELDALVYYDQKQAQLTIPIWYGIELYAGQETNSGSRLNPEETNGSLSYVGFSMSLLQNLLMDKRRAELKQAKIFESLSLVQRKILLNDLIREGLTAYWNWWKQFHDYQLMRSAITNAETRLRMVKSAVNTGERPAIDTLEAWSQVQTLIVKQNETYNELLKDRLALSAFLWMDQNKQYDLPPEVTPQEWKARETLPLEELLSLARLHPELEQYPLKLESLNIEKKLKFQMLLPNIKAKYNQLGYDFSSTINNPWFQNNYRYGVSFSMPLLLSQGRGEYRKVKLKMDQTKLELADKEATIFNKLKQYYTDWQQTYTQISLQNNLVNNLRSLQKGEETRFFAGEGSLFLVNIRESRTIEASQKLIEIKAKNQKALIALEWSAGLLWESN